MDVYILPVILPVLNPNLGVIFGDVIYQKERQSRDTTGNSRQHTALVDISDRHVGSE